MTWYIAGNISFGMMGGAGHTFFELVRPICILAQIFGMKYIFPPFPDITQEDMDGRYKPKIIQRNLPDDCTLGTLIKPAGKEWEEIWNLKESQITKCKTISVQLSPYKIADKISIEELKQFFDKFDRNKDTLFFIQNRCRLNINNIYKQFQNEYTQIRDELRQKCIYKSNILPKCITLHIRRGDIDKKALSSRGAREYIKKFYKVLLDTTLKYISPSEIRIISCGSKTDMNKIKKYFSSYPNVKFYLNVDTIETFRIIMNTDILLSGTSPFPLVAAYYSNSRIIVQCPLEARYLPVANSIDDLSKGCIISTDLRGKFDEKLLQNAINYLYPA